MLEPRDSLSDLGGLGLGAERSGYVPPESEVRGKRGELSKHLTMGRSARVFSILTGVSLVVGLMAITPGASAATPTYRAGGSVEQVYVTGLAPNAAVSLVTPAGQTLRTRNANSLGGAL